MFGFFGATLSAIFVSTLTSNIKLTAQLNALKEIEPQVREVQLIATKAKIYSEEAREQASKALQSVRDSAFEAKKMVANVKVAPLLSKASHVMDELRKIAREAAIEIAEKELQNGFEVLKTKKLYVVDEYGKNRIELSFDNNLDEDSFTKPSITMYDANEKIRSVYGLDENGEGHLAFRSSDNLNEIIVTNSKKWGIKNPNFLRRPNNGKEVETVFKD